MNRIFVSIRKKICISVILMMLLVLSINPDMVEGSGKITIDDIVGEWDTTRIIVGYDLFKPLDWSEFDDFDKTMLKQQIEIQESEKGKPPHKSKAYVFKIDEEHFHLGHHTTVEAYDKAFPYKLMANGEFKLIRPDIPSPWIIERSGRFYREGGTIKFDSTYESSNYKYIYKNNQHEYILYFKLVHNIIGAKMTKDSPRGEVDQGEESKEEDLKDEKTTDEKVEEVLQYLSRRGFYELNSQEKENLREAIIKSGYTLENYKKFEDNFMTKVEGLFAMPVKATSGLYKDWVGNMDRGDNFFVAGTKSFVSNAVYGLGGPILAGIDLIGYSIGNNIHTRAMLKDWSKDGGIIIDPDNIDFEGTIKGPINYALDGLWYKILKNDHQEVSPLQRERMDEGHYGPMVKEMWREDNVDQKRDSRPIQNYRTFPQNHPPPRVVFYE